MPLVDGFGRRGRTKVAGAAERGVGVSASQGTRREGNPEGHGYTSAHIGPWARLGKYLGARRAI
jgi:hypothetical protein